jgi:hypothetical protein
MANAKSLFRRSPSSVRDLTPIETSANENQRETEIARQSLKRREAAGERPLSCVILVGGPTGLASEIVAEDQELTGLVPKPAASVGRMHLARSLHLETGSCLAGLLAHGNLFMVNASGFRNGSPPRRSKTEEA